ncbi:hypothetical protein [Lysinibacillus sp. NPDC056232]|uniref:hypothetical protein n=1 Tax=Lysinibacillus sp. NPDC056232 TaxID=3345756 RepID=UPI0035DF6A73
MWHYRNDRHRVGPHAGLSTKAISDGLFICAKAANVFSSESKATATIMPRHN